MEFITNSLKKYNDYIKQESKLKLLKQDIIITKTQLNEKDYYFIFKHDGINIKILYDHRFTKGSGTTWAVGSQPDFTVLVDDVIIATFDAKNYSKSSQHKPDAIHKILAYMTNLDCGLGALFFPNYPTDNFKYPDGKESFYHHDLTVYHYQMKPAETDEALDIKQKTLDSMHEEIIKKIGERIPLTRQK